MDIFDGDYSTFGIFITVILFGFIVLVLTGLGILTKALFNLTTCGCSGSTVNQTKIDIINAIPDTSFVVGGKSAAISSVPTVATIVMTDDLKIKLNNTELIICQISICVFWIIILIAFLSFIASGWLFN